MKLRKAREILQLNLTEADASMPPDVHDALEIHIEAISQLIRFRDGSKVDFTKLLPGETEEK